LRLLERPIVGEVTEQQEDIEARIFDCLENRLQHVT